jgi:hypothetical protein
MARQNSGDDRQRVMRFKTNGHDTAASGGKLAVRRRCSPSFLVVSFFHIQGPAGELVLGGFGRIREDTSSRVQPPATRLNTLPWLVHAFQVAPCNYPPIPCN